MNFVWLYTLDSNRYLVECRLYTSFENNWILEWFNSFLEVILRGSFFLDWAHIFWECLPKRQFSTNHQWNRYIGTGTITLDLIVQANKCRCTVADQSGGLTFGTPELLLIRVDDWLPVFSSESLGVSYLCMHPSRWGEVDVYFAIYHRDWWQW